MKHPLTLVDSKLARLSSAYLNLVIRTYTIVIPLVLTTAFRHLYRGLWFAIRGQRALQFVEFLAGAKVWGRYVSRVNDVQLEIQGDMRVPERGHLIFLNHVNEMDFPFDSLVIGKPYLANQVIKRALPAYLWMRAMGSQVFDNSQARSIKASVDNLLRHLPTQSYIVYPEGANTYSEEIQPLRKGMIRVAFDNQIPIFLALKAGITGFQHSVAKPRILYRACGIFDPRDYDSWTALRDALQATMEREKASLNAQLSAADQSAGAA